MIAAVNGHPRAVSVCWRAVCPSYLAPPLALPLSPPLFTFSAHLLASVGCASAWHEYLIVVVSLKPWVAGVRAYHTEEECVLASPVLGHALCMSAASGGVRLSAAEFCGVCRLHLSPGRGILCPGLLFVGYDAGGQVDWFQKLHQSAHQL